jgi:hypothetical protein
VVVENPRGISDQKYEVEFHEAIASAIPSFIQLLEDEDARVRLKVAELIRNLENHGKRQ